jgi:predicted Rossmann fold flavoprotein
MPDAVKTGTFDTAVIGAGPAGMMAAGIAAQHGAKTVLVEKNVAPGRKLLLTGKGRCNITNAETNPARFIDALGRDKKGKFLYPALNAFGPAETVRFFNKRGLPTIVERGNRVFPESGKAADVLKVLTAFLMETGVTVLTHSPVRKLLFSGSSVLGMDIGRIITAANYILCTGGLSYPATGSSGEGLLWLEELGHTVIQPKPALVPLRLKEKWVRELHGLDLRNVRISVYGQDKKQWDAFGEASFAGDSIGGPIILDMSKQIGVLLEKGPVRLHIDLKPALEHNRLDERLQRDFKVFHNKKFKNSLDKLLPKMLIPVMVRLSGIDPLKKVNSITREERKRLVHLFKEVPVTVRSLQGIEKGIITCGGVSLKEVDPRTMCSTRFNNLYFAGEILDLDGPTGGYNLQVCWSTAYIAGNKAAEVQNSST